ncbi:PP2C family protein-serine/threonine phosphatase [Falsarthrobacter nasiphocae]|uniref:Protein phosphatase n=1 Tax=Falsarthrobacter nasiphocae TaxID=189863 RepID=A0AAE4C569_9MICC|nr:protein phosphatase 2C domain-containing protein [Falsarthrobacter nasiphocae]MDR6892041.1 protein phosphatase [Falsarthrobacter nasiphocae]
MQLVFDFAARTDVGQVRQKNDDSAYAGRRLAVLGDGMGGHAGGNVASATAVLGLAPLDRPGLEDAALSLADEIQNANLLMNEIVKTNPELSGMGTTLTALLIDGDRLQFAHIGDSRAYRLRDGVFEQVSLDHTFVQRLVDEGRLLPEQAKTHPHRNVIARVLGDSDASPEVDLATLDIHVGERWLLCSDGLTDVVSLEEIEEVVRSTEDLDAITDILVRRTLEGGAPDNVTVAVVDVREEGTEKPHPSAPVTRPSPAPSEAAADAPSAALLRQDLERRPHVLVGAAALATETGQLPVVTAHTAESRALAADDAPAATDEPADSEKHLGADEDHPEAGSARKRERNRPWMLPAVLGVLVLLVALVGTLGYMWTQTRYYVGEDNGKVAVYNGVSQRLGPVRLSHVQETSSIDVAVLPENARQNVSRSIPANDLAHAESIVESLRSMARAHNCFPAVTAPGGKGSPSPSASASPSGKATPSPSASASPKPSAKPSTSASTGSAPGPSVAPGPTTTICGD